MPVVVPVEQSPDPGAVPEALAAPEVAEPAAGPAAAWTGSHALCAPISAPHLLPVPAAAPVQRAVAPVRQAS